nr:MAG TPA: hypothetical protein [Caudoviricetes sp.]
MLNKGMLLVAAENKNYLDDAHVIISCAQNEDAVGYGLKGFGAINRIPYWSSANIKQMWLTEFASYTNSSLILTFMYSGANLSALWSSSMTISINNRIKCTASLKMYNQLIIYGKATGVSIQDFLGQDIGVSFDPAPTHYR